VTNPRKAIRFHPDPLTVGLIDFKIGTKAFKPTLVGIVINESYTGCAMIVVTDLKLKKDMPITIQVGNLSPMKGKIAWLKTLEENIHKLGIQLLE
jgi:hypothetical protein